MALLSAGVVFVSGAALHDAALGGAAVSAHRQDIDVLGGVELHVTPALDGGGMRRDGASC